MKNLTEKSNAFEKISESHYSIDQLMQVLELTEKKLSATSAMVEELTTVVERQKEKLSDKSRALLKARQALARYEQIFEKYESHYKKYNKILAFWIVVNWRIKRLFDKFFKPKTSTDYFLNIKRK